MKRLLLLLISLVAVPSAFAQEHAMQNDYRSLDPADIAFTVTQFSKGNPLPFQGIAVRMQLRNICKDLDRLGPIYRLEVGERYLGIKGPEDKTFRKFGEPLSWVDLDPPPKGQEFTEFERRSGYPFHLEPGMETDYVICLSADWFWDGKPSRLRKTGEPLFPAPGEYVLKFGYPLDVKNGKVLEKTLTVKVETPPQGDDAAVYDIVKSNEALKSVLMSSIQVADDEQTKALEKIVQDYPKASYTRYARFALARKYINGPGNNSFSEAQAQKAKDIFKSLATRSGLDSGERYLYYKVDEKLEKRFRVGLDGVRTPELLYESLKVVPDFLWDKSRKYWPEREVSP